VFYRHWGAPLPIHDMAGHPTALDHLGLFPARHKPCKSKVHPEEFTPNAIIINPAFSLTASATGPSDEDKKSSFSRKDRAEWPIAKRTNRTR